VVQVANPFTIPM